MSRSSPSVELETPSAVMFAAGGEIDAAIAKRLDNWNARLLDLSKRNRLLYFNPAIGKQTRAPHGIRCVEPGCDAIWNRLARLGKAQQFPELLSEFEQIIGEEPVLAVARPLKSDEIRTEPSGERLNRALTNLRSRARVSVEEAGIVTLFLAFGFLRWSEDEAEFYAPLLLVPVELVRSSPRDAYRLIRHDDEVLVNPALRHKLETDFNIALPAAPPIESKSLSDYWGQVLQALASSTHAPVAEWSVLDWVYLSVFSFHKLAMFRDLRDHRARLRQHPLVRALGGDHEVPLNPDIAVPVGAELEQIPPHEMELVLDADSSQHEAIIAARRGLSFVLQGPPGTGKSQTIANIIAECLESDKKVLFVSEKMAALEVVERRLHNVGLGDFCLEVHSHKANKRAIIAELERTLRLPQRPQLGSHVNDDELAALRARLNAYVAELHHPHERAQITPHAALGHLAQLNDAPTLPFDFPGASAQSPSQRAKLTQWLREFDRLDTVWSGYNTHPWRGVRLRDTSLQTRELLRSHLETASETVATFATGWDTWCQHWGVSRTPSLHGAKRLLELTNLVREGAALRPEVVAGWLETKSLDTLGELTRAYGPRFQRLQARRADFEAHWQPEVFNLNARSIRSRLNGASEWLERVGGAEAAQSNRAALETHFAAMPGLGELGRLGAGVAATLGLAVPVTWNPVVQLHQAAQLLQKQSRPRAAWFAPGALAELERHLEAARRDTEQRIALETQLGSRWQLDKLLALPCTELAERFQTHYSRFFARWGGTFKADRARLQNALRPGTDFDLQSASADLRAAGELQTRRQHSAAENTLLAERFGSAWRGDHTDWDALEHALGAARELSAHWNDEVPPGVVSVVCGESGALELAREQEQQLETLLTRLTANIKALFALFTTRQLPFTDLPFTYAPLSELQAWLATGCDRFAEFFTALDEVDACGIGPAPSVAERLIALETADFMLRETASLAAASDELSASFSPLFEGLETRWETVASALDWGERVRTWFGATMPASFLSVLRDPARRTAALQNSMRWQMALSTFQPILESITNQFEPISVDDVALEQVEFGALSRHFAAQVARFSELDDWLAYQALHEGARELGISLDSPAQGFWEALHAQHAGGGAPAREHVDDTFWKRFWTMWVDEAVSKSPLLSTFNGDAHEIVVARFARLDGENGQRAREWLRAQLASRKPHISLNTPRTGQMAILGREAVKKTRHMAIRALFAQIGELAQALKPCMLMSPLSVAQFLPPDKVHFDVVIFDEASQISPEDAIGALVRGKQVIVVGDNQQMPPTQFFAAHEADETEDGNDGIVGIESILDECLSARLPEKKLLWHYRSHFEELIAFSNRHFYRGELLTFPGPVVAEHTEHRSNRALTWERVEGFYMPSGSGNAAEAQTNRIEARRVAELAVEHARTTPERSLGIITFNESQRRAVETEVYRLTVDNPALDAFFWAEREDVFFVKALENVQGDERDVILFSVGFGPRRDKDGTVKPMLMNFGPLGRQGGERRLNVAITRARQQVRIVTSFDPAAIDLERAKSEGVRLLKAYLEWAQGNRTTASRALNVLEHDAVGATLAKVLQSAGWKTHQGVGLGECRVDVGIEDPEEPGHLLLGVLCDGDNYRRSTTARDRDRLRPQMLERLGWQLHRVWSPNWVKNPQRELSHVIEALNRAQAMKHRSQLNGPQLASDFAFSVKLATSPAVELALESEAHNVSIESEVLPLHEWDELPLTEHQVSEAVFEPVMLTRRGDAEEFHSHAQENSASILEALIQVVDGEGPINARVAARRVVAAWEMTRAGTKSQQIIAQIASEGAARGDLQIRREALTIEDWYWPQGMVHPRPRRPGPNGERRPEEVALEEIREAALAFIKSGYGVEQDELMRLTARFFGWKLGGARVQNRVEAALGLLEGDQRLAVQNGSYVVRV